MIALGRVEIGFQRQAGKADDAVERRAQLVGHVGKELGLDARRFLGALFRQIQFDVLDLHLLQRFAQIGGRLIDVVLHLFVIGGQRHRHRVDAVFQHIQLAEHKALDAAVELSAANAVNGIDHVANRPGHIAHQPPAENQRDTDAEQHHDAGDKHLLILLQANGLQIQLQRHVAEHVLRHFRIRVGRLVGRVALRDNGRAQDHQIAAANDAQLARQRRAVGQLQFSRIKMVVGGHKQPVVLIVNGDGAHNIRMAAVQNADKLTDGLAILQVHAIFTGHRQRLNNAGSGVLQLALQVMIAMYNKEDAEQQTDKHGRGQNQDHHTRAQAVVGHGGPLWENQG